MEKIATLFGKYQKPPQAKRHTERGDLFDTILSRLNPDRAKKKLPTLTHGRLGYLLTGIKTTDLYALLSKMNDGEHRGIAPGVIFWTEIKPQKQKL
jgi:hypothetical protein